MLALELSEVGEVEGEECVVAREFGVGWDAPLCSDADPPEVEGLFATGDLEACELDRAINAKK